MNVIHSKRMGALLAVLVVAAAGCGGGSDGNDNGGGGGGGPEGLHVTVVLPEALRNGGPAGFSTTVSGISVTTTLDGEVVTPDEVHWTVADATGQWAAPGDAAPSPATGATTSVEIGDFETLRQAANAWLGRVYGHEEGFDYVQAPGREGLLSFGPQQVQAMSYQVIATVRRGGETASGGALISPVTVSRGGNPSPLGMMVVANSPADTNAWTLSYLPTDAGAGAEFGPPPSGVALAAADGKNPYVVPTVAGVYRLQNGTNKPILFRVSTYHGAGRTDADEGEDGVACNGCHGPTSHGDYTLAQFAEWQESAHARVAGSEPAVSLFQHGLDGGLGSHYGERCVSCHTVGYSKVPSARNGGFDDVAADAGWYFPVPAAGNFAAMPAGLRHRAGVQCESCHGPLEPADHSMVAAVGYGTVAPVASMDAGICMTCHDGLEDGNQGPQWATTGHANTQLALDDASFEARGANAAHCGRCHAAEGFAVYLRQQQAGTPGNIARPTTCREGTPGCVCTTPGDASTCAPAAAATCTPREGFTAATDPFDPLCPCKPTAPATTCSGDPAMYYYLDQIGMTKPKIHPVTCQTCHEPHSTELRLATGDTQTTAGLFRIQNAGKGALCIVCHNSRGAAVRQGTFVLPGFAAPHVAAQGDVFAGRNAYFVPSLVAGQVATDLPWLAPHAGAADSCVLCHVNTAGEDLREKYKLTRSNHTFHASMEGCANCHSAAEVAEFEEDVEATEAKMAQLLGLITNFIRTRLNATGFDAATRYDYVTDANLPAPTDPTVEPGQVTLVELFESHGAPAVKLTLQDGTRFGTTLANLKVYNAPAPTPSVPYVPDVFPVCVVPAGQSRCPTPATAGADQTLARSVYNYLLLHGGAAEGVHNPPFVTEVLDRTITAMTP